MMHRFSVLMAFAAVALAGCAWVKMEPDAVHVRVLATDVPVRNCIARGEIQVSVRDQVGLYHRSELKVRDELETLARNEAVTLGADTIQPLEEPGLGEQRFAAFSCGNAVPARSASPAPQRATPALQVEDAETFPVTDPR